MKNPLAGSPRFPARRYSEQGESAPKAKPKGAVDGNQVNNPGLFRWSEVGTEKARGAGGWKSRWRYAGGTTRKNRLFVNTEVLKGLAEMHRERTDAKLPRKAAKR